MIDPRILAEIAALITTVGALFAVLLKARKVNSDVQSARDKRNFSLENTIYRRLQREIDKQDEKIKSLESRYDECEAKHEQALHEIEELRAGRKARDERISNIEEKVHVIEDRTIKPEDLR